MKTFWIIAGIIGALVIVLWVVNKGPQLFKLPSGNTASVPPTVNESGTSYGNLT